AGAATQPRELQTVTPGARPPIAKARPLVGHTAKQQEYNEQEGIVTAIGDVYVSQSGASMAEFLEIRADAAVLFLAERPPGRTPRSAGTNPANEPFPTEAPARRRGVGPANLGSEA